MSCRSKRGNAALLWNKLFHTANHCGTMDSGVFSVAVAPWNTKYSPI